jgi:hypothetical protein
MSIAAIRIAGFTHNTAAENDNTKYATKLEACSGPSCATSVDLFGAREPDNHLLMTAAQLLNPAQLVKHSEHPNRMQEPARIWLLSETSTSHPRVPVDTEEKIRADAE